MEYVLKNGTLTAKVETYGAELRSVVKEGCEYLWQGDPAYWAGQAPVLFPICGRLVGGEYTYLDKTYEMTLHGFAKRSEFTVVSHTDEEIVLMLRESEATLGEYPFPFTLTVTYTLEGSEIHSSLTVKNTGDGVLPFTLGAHPGFCVPLDTGDFSDWRLRFPGGASPDRLVFSDTCFNTGIKRAFPLEGGDTLPLRHEMFDNDAIFLSRVPDRVRLESPNSRRFVEMIYPEFPYLGFWHKPHSDAPYVCIEPWCGLPTFDGETEDFATKCDMFRILPGAEKSLGYRIVIG